MQLQIITPEKILFEGNAEMITIPGSDGEFGVLTGHAPLISSLREGTITIDLAGKTQKKIHVTGGLAEVTPERCTVLVERITEDR